MIHAVSDRADLAAIDALTLTDPFACRVLSLFDSYPPTLPFVGYWTQQTEAGAVTGALARSGADLIICLTAASDLAELASFAQLLGAARVLCGDAALFDDRPFDTGPILTRETPFADDSGECDPPDLRAAYALLQACADEHFQPPVFEDFYVDVSHKLRHGCIRMTGVSRSGSLAAMAMTVAETDKSAVIGAVACAPAFRGQGYGSAAVKRLTNALLSEGKAVYLQRAADKNRQFYDRLGFTACGSWREYR